MPLRTSVVDRTFFERSTRKAKQKNQSGGTGGSAWPETRTYKEARYHTLAHLSTLSLAQFGQLALWPLLQS